MANGQRYQRTAQGTFVMVRTDSEQIARVKCLAPWQTNL
jgi:hypothetical protein